MTEPEQCIICLDHLPRPSTELGGASDGSLDEKSNTASDPAATIANGAVDEDSSYLNIVAALDGCEHVIHDACIRSWAQKTNTCPICRNHFHSVRVYNGVDGTAISTYTVQDKKQVAEFDFQQWVGENPEEEEEEPGNPCPICNSSEREDILLLCDSCDAAYHTSCIGLEHIPEGDWYCMECAHLFELTDESQASDARPTSPRPQVVRRPNPRSVRGYHVRTRARLRRARRQARNVEWQGAWGQFSGRFYEMSELDLDNHDDEDEDLEQYRRFQQLDRRELQRWQQRMNIANRLGARDAFATNIPPEISERLEQPPAPPPPPPVETRDERRAWGAFDRVREAEESNSTSRKRKVRSVTASPAEPAQEPERKLKRPRTRRLPTNGEGSASAPSAAPATVAAASSPTSATPATARVVTAPPNGPAARNGHDQPLVSTLLKELEPNQMSDEETPTATPGWRHPPDASSPANSPSPSAHSSPRALSLTPPPFQSANGGRPGSPTLSLSTHIQPKYPPANYSPNRSGGDQQSDSEGTAEGGGLEKTDGRPLELRQPRPRRPQRRPRQVDEGSSPPRSTMTQEDKRNINEIVKGALRPHWRAQKLSTEQYAIINRDVSRKLYDEVKNASLLDVESRKTWEKRAAQEVAQAVAELQT